MVAFGLRVGRVTVIVSLFRTRLGQSFSHTHTGKVLYITCSICYWYSDTDI